MAKKVIILAFIVLGLFAILHFGPEGQLSLENLKAQQAGMNAAYQANPLYALSLFFLFYVGVTAFSLPGAAIMTIAAGALFGLVTGTILVSFASTIGATLAFLGSRHLFRDWVERKFGARLQPVNDGIARDGPFYLLTLRLVPVFPFFLINLLMGLTPIRTWTFFWVSQAGMILGTIVYVNAGTQLAKISTLADIASPALLGSFVALGLLPWAAKWLVARLRPTQASG